MTNKEIIERASGILYNLEPDEILSSESISIISSALMIARVMERSYRENLPLTIEQLLSMNGEPVWVEFEDGSGGLWGIVHLAIFNQIVFPNGLHCTIGEKFHGKTYKAYKNRPEEKN